MKFQVAKDPIFWNKIVKRSPYGVLHHIYEIFCEGRDALPLIFQEGKNNLLFPLEIRKLLGSKIATSPIYYHASLLPSDTDAIRYIPETLECTVDYLRKLGFDLLSTSAPTFLSKTYAKAIDLWFRKNEAALTAIYAHMLNLKGKFFDDVWKTSFSKHARNAVRKAEKVGVHTHQIKNIGAWIEDIICCNISSLKRQGRPMIRRRWDKALLLEYLEWHEKALGDYFHLYGSFFDNHLIAYMTTIEFNKLIMITSAMSDSKYLSKRPNDVLLTYIIKHACEANFDWIYYSFDRVSYYQDVPSLLRSLTRFKFEHGFQEIPIPVYRLGLTRAGKFLQYSLSASDYAFIWSARLPVFLTELLQQLYDRYSRLEPVKALLFT